ncbi:MAG: hypothetical protein CMJ48_03450 [Planctomycetaceae bacterium]|nr:hypothetical protein [Planctomycetaceae bacterium]
MLADQLPMLDRLERVLRLHDGQLVRLNQNIPPVVNVQPLLAPIVATRPPIVRVVRVRQHRQAGQLHLRQLIPHVPRVRRHVARRNLARYLIPVRVVRERR